MAAHIAASAERAATLTKQLLAYAGKGRLETRPTDVSQLVRDVAALVKAAIPKHVAVRFDFSPDMPLVQADLAELQQLVMNLVINAAEAVGTRPGTVHIRTGAQEVDAQFIAMLHLPYDVPPGRYVMLEVVDTGCGMGQATMAKIFDPFFSTKFQGRGLGLSAVQGIVCGHHGALKVYSAPGRGTTFKLLLPASPEAVIAQPLAGAPAAVRGNGVVLVVDDEPIVRQAADHSLRHFGYSALFAADGHEAVETFARHPEIAAVLLDVSMAAMGGEETLA